eukprot:m.357933 g.357933  ORF g.357933 m.357933 type:complete len:254 (-) comp17990_c0_seq1:107-868(-)
MKLTADLIILSPQFTNPLKDREIDLRENKISVIENLGATLDQFDVIDLSDNDVRLLDGFPQLKRLKTLLLSNNRVVSVATGLGTALPSLREVILTNNHLASLADLSPLFECKGISTLSLLRNPVTAVANYRLFVIYHLPALKLLDFTKVTQKERDQAAAMFGGDAGDERVQEILKESKISQPVAAVKEASVQKKAEVAAETAKNAALIQEAIQNATSLDEVRRLEAQLQQGIVPGAANAAKEDKADKMDSSAE